MVKVVNEHSTSPHSIVLDLDETLVRTLSVNEDEEAALKILDILGIYVKPEFMDIRSRSFRVCLDDPVTPKGAGRKHGCWGIARPHMYEFLIFAFTYFRTVNIWSAGVDDYVRKIVRDITKHSNVKIFKVYTREDCVREDGEYVKPLSKMIKEFPEMGTLEHLFVVDDRAITYKHNVDNGVLIPLYKPSPTISSLRMEDDNLLRFKRWLLRPEVINSKDIRTLDKSKIFTKSLSEA